MKLNLRRNRNKDSLHRDNIYAKQPPRENFVMQWAYKFSILSKAEILWRQCCLSLVTTTVAERTARMRCTTEVINVERPAISNADNDWPPTAIPVPVKAHFPGHLTIRHTRVTTSQPTRRVCTTPPWTWARRSHSLTRSTVKSKPSRTNGIITISVISGVGYLSVSTVECSVVLAFWKYKRKIVTGNISTRHKYWRKSIVHYQDERCFCLINKREDLRIKKKTDLR